MGVEIAKAIAQKAENTDKTEAKLPYSEAVYQYEHVIKPRNGQAVARLTGHLRKQSPEIESHLPVTPSKA